MSSQCKTQELGAEVQVSYLSKQLNLRGVTPLFAMLLKDYGLERPKWFQHGAKLNRNRLAWIKKLLCEAGLDKDWCQWAKNDGSWANELHRFYHEVV